MLGNQVLSVSINTDLTGSSGAPLTRPRGASPNGTAAAVSRSGHAAGLHAILDPDCALAIWERTPAADLTGLIRALDFETVDDVDETLPTAGMTLHAAVLLGAAGYEGDTAVALANEIGEMAARLTLIAPTDRLRVRLEIVETDACRRFHADMVTLRLLSTLSGPGTQWIEIDRPEDIREIPTGAIALFKGRLLIDGPTILHRSPPIAGTGARRLVLVIDPL